MIDGHGGIPGPWSSDPLFIQSPPICQNQIPATNNFQLHVHDIICRDYHNNTWPNTVGLANASNLTCTYT